MLVIENFNATAPKESFVDEMLKYRCRILFTTRSRYEDYTSMEWTELSPGMLLALVSKFFAEVEKKAETDHRDHQTAS